MTTGGDVSDDTAIEAIISIVVVTILMLISVILYVYYMHYYYKKHRRCPSWGPPTRVPHHTANTELQLELQVWTCRSCE